MLVTNHMEVNKKPEQNYTAAVSKEELGAKVQEQTTAQQTDKEIEVAISGSGSEGTVLSDAYLQAALENVLASQSSVMDVEQAEAMIRKANQNILANANESVLAQANQTTQMVTELSK